MLPLRFLTPPQPLHRPATPLTIFFQRPFLYPREIHRTCGAQAMALTLAWCADPPLNSEGGSALILCSVALAELLHHVAALRGGLWRDEICAAGGYFFSHRVPIRSVKKRVVKSVPLLTVGFDQDQCLVIGPARRWKLPYRLCAAANDMRRTFGDDLWV
ncbi:hypothetical protein L6452_05766 [Arctium lappa]|uniref:Uncharacterized protein n=1 Tax=Arctium lappa TaxID=4217 RepID=A0ACB9EGR3_ARCLA|nr:hypothetical protein L6452_05766 [Arctium lappa]